MRTISFLLVVALMAVLVASSATAYNRPTVDFSFDAATFSYIYTVTVEQTDDFPLGYLQLDTLVKSAGLQTFTMIGPVEGTADLDWSTLTEEWQPGCDSAVWYVDTSLGQVEIMPSQLSGDWVGVFTLRAPNTQPGEGFGLTMDGALPSINSFTINVPGPTVPEPSSVIALASGLLGIGGMLLRRRA